MRPALRLLSLGLALALLVGPAGGATAAEEAIILAPGAQANVPAAPRAVKERTFVPLHSTVIVGGGRTKLNFSGSLSIHNTSADTVLVIDAIEYRNAAGELVQSYLQAPLGLRPFASAQVTIAQDDVRGGVGPSFVIDWSAAETIDPPAVEAVMIAVQGTQGFSFVSQGRRLSRP